MTLDTWPAAERNKQPILDALTPRLPARGTVLEVASGTGQHVAHFAAALPHLTFQPTDLDPDHRATITARIAATGLTNIRPPIALDARDDPWPVDPFDAVYCANMIHIAPWAAALGLLAGAGRHLPTDGRLVLYGPFKFHGTFTAPSNDAFDQRLRARDPSWGVRDLARITEVAAASGLAHVETVEMPANNHLVVFARR